MYETKYRKRALEIWEASKEETKQEIFLDLKINQMKLLTILANLKSILTHKKSVQ